MAQTVYVSAPAQRDIDAAVAWYLQEADATTALLLVSAIEDAFTKAAQTPGAGSPRYGRALDIPQLRTRAIDRFPYLVFYLTGSDRIDVLRVLHQSRDIPSILQER